PAETALAKPPERNPAPEKKAAAPAAAAPAETALAKPPERNPAPEKKPAESASPSPAPAAKSVPASPGGKSLPKSIRERYPEPVTNDADLAPESPNAVSIVAKELVWVQIQDGNGVVVKDMVLQPGFVFRVPEGGNYTATLGNATSVRMRVGAKDLPPVGSSGEMVERLPIAADALRNRVGGR
ncbi:MAG: DUF4115 domain-containing protein, partial [Magnetococcales bacterium]|nr:DUF4115 domain-containing protein [Magnetococcales bacterium]